MPADEPKKTAQEPPLSYFEAGLLVSTAAYHLKRGHCCGSGSLTTERGRDGKPVTSHTQKFGSGTITTRSDGSSTRTEKFGSGTLQRDQPGRTSR